MGLVRATQFRDAEGVVHDLDEPIEVEEWVAQRYSGGGILYFWSPVITQTIPIPDIDLLPIFDPVGDAAFPTPNPPSEILPGIGGWLDRILEPIREIFRFTPPPTTPWGFRDSPDPEPVAVHELRQGMAEPNPPFVFRDSPGPAPTPVYERNPGMPEPNPPSFIPAPKPLPAYVSPRDPEAPRIVQWDRYGAPTPNPPSGYRDLETFPIPGRIDVVSPVKNPSIEQSLTPREFFPENPGHGWFWDDATSRYVDLSSQFLSPGEQYVPEPAPAAPVPIIRTELALPPHVEQRDPWTQETWAKYRAEIAAIRDRSSAPPPQSAPVDDSMAKTRSPALASTGDVSTDTPDTGSLDTNALLTQALAIVGVVADNFTQKESTAPAPSAQPTEKKMAWYKEVPPLAWGLGAVLLLFLAFRRSR